MNKLAPEQAKTARNVVEKAMLGLGFNPYTAKAGGWFLGNVAPANLLAGNFTNAAYMTLTERSKNARLLAEQSQGR